MEKILPLVSVLMPCYNAEKYLREAIDSIINQTYKNLEILLIDDGSTDHTWQILEEYSHSDKRIRLIRNDHNLGLIRTLNKGIVESRGEYIARMDADDISDILRIEKIINVFNEYPSVEVIAAGYYHLSADGKRKRKIYPKAISTKPLYFVSFFAIPVVHPCIVAKRHSLQDNLYDEAFLHSEDYELFSRMLNRGCIFLNLNEPLYYLRKNEQSVSHKYEKVQIANHSRISRRNIERYFNLSFEYFIHKIMINRIKFDISPKLIKKAFKNLDDLRSCFIEREHCSDGEITEINGFLVELKFDIMIQAIKYSTWINKILMISLILQNVNVFTCKRGIQYLRSKIW